MGALHWKELEGDYNVGGALTNGSSSAVVIRHSPSAFLLEQARIHFDGCLY